MADWGAAKSEPVQHLVFRHWNTATWGRGGGGSLSSRKDLKQELKPMWRVKRETLPEEEEEADSTFSPSLGSLHGGMA